MREDFLDEHPEIFFDAVDVRLVPRARNQAGHLPQPRGKTAIVPFRAAVGPEPHNAAEIPLPAEAHEAPEVGLSGEVVEARLRLVHAPEDIKGNAVESRFLAAVEDSFPLIMGNTGVVNFAGKNQVAAPAE